MAPHLPPRSCPHVLCCPEPERPAVWSVSPWARVLVLRLACREVCLIRFPPVSRVNPVAPRSKPGADFLIGSQSCAGSSRCHDRVNACRPGMESVCEDPTRVAPRVIVPQGVWKPRGSGCRMAPHRQVVPPRGVGSGPDWPAPWSTPASSHAASGWGVRLWTGCSPVVPRILCCSPCLYGRFTGGDGIPDHRVFSTRPVRHGPCAVGPASSNPLRHSCERRNPRWDMLRALGEDPGWTVARPAPLWFAWHTPRLSCVETRCASSRVGLDSCVRRNDGGGWTRPGPPHRAMPDGAARVENPRWSGIPSPPVKRP